MSFKASRRQLTDKETAWLIKHFCHTKNADIMAKLDIRHSHLHDLARIYNLTKTKQFMRKAQANCTEHARRAHERIKNEEPQRWAELQEIRRNNLHWDDPTKKHNFRKGESNKDRLSRKRYEQSVAKMVETLRRKRERDRVRVAMGLKPLTNLALGVPTKLRRALYMAKYHLTRAYGYERGEGLTMYVTEDTRRTTAEYLYIRRYGMKFVVKAEADKPRMEVKLPPSWSDKQGGISSSY